MLLTVQLLEWETNDHKPSCKKADCGIEPLSQTLHVSPVGPLGKSASKKHQSRGRNKASFLQLVLPEIVRLCWYYTGSGSWSIATPWGIFTKIRFPVIRAVTFPWMVGSSMALSRLLKISLDTPSLFVIRIPRIESPDFENVLPDTQIPRRFPFSSRVQKVSDAWRWPVVVFVLTMVLMLVLMSVFYQIEGRCQELIRRLFEFSRMGRARFELAINELWVRCFDR